MNQLVLDLLKQDIGMQKKKRYTRTHDDLDDLFGQWSDAEFEEIQGSVDNQRKIDLESPFQQTISGLPPWPFKTV